MKFFKLSAITAAVLCSSVAMAATPAQQQAYQYNQNAGVIANTAGAVTGTAKTLFNTATHPGAISAEIGTLGYGANIAWGLNETTELQAGWSGMNFDGDHDLDGNDSWINYDKVLGDGYGSYKGELDYDFDFSNPYIGVQMRPFANNFTVAGGVMVPDNKLKAKITADPSSVGDATVSIDGYKYQVDSATIKAENKSKLAPYVTIGYRPNINQHWGGFFEVGAAYMGKLEAKVTDHTVRTVRDENPNTGLTFEEAAKNEIEEDDFWYPIVKAGATYRF